MLFGVGECKPFLWQLKDSVQQQLLRQHGTPVDDVMLHQSDKETETGKGGGCNDREDSSLLGRQRVSKW